MKYCFLQVSTNLINENTLTDETSEYYQKIWTNRKKFGYKKPEHFWEIPVWIAELSYVIRKPHNKQLFIITENNPVLPDADVYFASVLDVNKHILKNIMLSNPEKIFCIGGYVDKAYFDDMDYFYCQWFDNIEDYCKRAGFNYVYGTDYSLFADLPCIPRLTLSTGCKHSCKFCTIPQEIGRICDQNIIQQTESLNKLDFELVYINDKTFGQCKNHGILTVCYDIIKRYNPVFKGFIVQTTCQQVLKFNKKYVDVYKDSHIKIVELGIETYNNDILKQYRKPQNCKIIDKAIDILENQQVKIIPNIMIGLIGESQRTYDNTLYWLVVNHKRFFMLNVYNFTVYDNADVASEVLVCAADKNELQQSRSYHDTKETAILNMFSQGVYETGIKILNYWS